MVLPLILAGAAGILGTVAGGTLLGGGGSKKEIHAAQEHYAPVITDSRSLAQVYSPTYQYQIDSPEATMTSKKTSEATATSKPNIAPQRSESMTEGTDLTKIAMIGGAALIGYGIVTEVL